VRDPPPLNPERKSAAQHSAGGRAACGRYLSMDSAYKTVSHPFLEVPRIPPASPRRLALPTPIPTPPLAAGAIRVSAPHVFESTSRCRSAVCAAARGLASSCALHTAALPVRGGAAAECGGHHP
jgi:hypothetical protein